MLRERSLPRDNVMCLWSYTCVTFPSGNRLSPAFTCSSPMIIPEWKEGLPCSLSLFVVATGTDPFIPACLIEDTTCSYKVRFASSTRHHLTECF